MRPGYRHFCASRSIWACTADRKYLLSVNPEAVAAALSASRSPFGTNTVILSYALAIYLLILSELVLPPIESPHY